MNSNYIPRSDDSFVTWSSNFSTYLTAHTAELPIDSQQAAAISAEVSGFRTNLNGLTAARDASQAACQTKDAKRETAEAAIRSIVRQFQASPDVTDAQREAMGIPVHSDTKRSAVAEIFSRPLGMVDTSERMRHRISYWDEATPNKRAKPAHTLGCEIWYVLTLPTEVTPLEPTAYQSLGLNTASPFMVTYAGKDIGKMAHYMLRWVGTTGEIGAWSDIISATIVG
jgi:hypothetical protein